MQSEGLFSTRRVDCSNQAVGHFTSVPKTVPKNRAKNIATRLNPVVVDGLPEHVNDPQVTCGQVTEHGGQACDEGRSQANTPVIAGMITAGDVTSI